MFKIFLTNPAPQGAKRPGGAAEGGARGIFEPVSKKSAPGDLGRGIFEPGSKKSAPGTGQGIFETGYGDTIFEQGHFEVLGHIFYGGRKPPTESLIISYFLSILRNCCFCVRVSNLDFLDF